VIHARSVGWGWALFDLHEDGAAGVLAGEIADDGGVFEQGAGFLGIDDEIHQRGVGARLVLLPELAEFPVDLRDRNLKAQFGTKIGDVRSIHGIMRRSHSRKPVSGLVALAWSRVSGSPIS
jgi:hypothetical protein